MKTYTIEEFKNKIHWEEVESLSINEFPWYESGLKQDTFVQLALKDESLFIKVKALDSHSSGKILEENGPVYLDSCFEFFLTPKNELSNDYMNFEINCIGNLYLAVKNKNGKKRADARELEQVKIKTSLPYMEVKEPQDEDKSWTLDIEIPLKFMEDFYGESIDEDLWHGNFYRIGGSVDDQYGCWNPIVSEKPNYHLPLQFGRIALKKKIK